ncbi:MAG: hypothetical protein JOZ81_19025, partial [Chloroflexi bacterium]|nr:hypothetical protein [Chloroflexota bacterium]
MLLDRHTLAGRGLVLVLTFAIAAWLVLPGSVFAQTATPGATSAPTSAPTNGPTSTPQPTSAPAAALTLSDSKGAQGKSITANGTGFRPTETVDVTFNGASVGTPVVGENGSFSLSFNVPNVPLGTYGVLATGRNTGLNASANFEVTAGPAAITLSVPQAEPGTNISISATGFTPGEVVQMLFNGAQIGTPTADTQGSVTTPFTIPQLSPGTYVAEAHGQTSGYAANASFNILATSGTPQPTAGPTAGPTTQPTAQPTNAPTAVPNAPPMAHDERYFVQTGYRIDSDQVWGFFNDYGAVSTFGFPVSRTMTFLGCPVQMFQALIIQVCGNGSPALINMLDPDIFPYTKVNGSTFPSADETMKNNTPPVSDPNYSVNIINFVNQNVPDNWQGRQVNYLQTFNSLGGLTIWGAPISQPAADPANAGFIYQRFQRGIMHYDASQNVTQRILLADYLKAIIMNQNVPGDLLAQAQSSRFFKQYCPGNAGWLCRPNDLSGTDL